MGNGAITEILHRAKNGEAAAEEQLMESVYLELRKIARHQLESERQGHTLQATALVHEAYLRLLSRERITDWQSREHFFAAAARVMRRVLVDYARSHRAAKRTGNLARVELEEFAGLADTAAAKADEIVAVDEILDRLGEFAPRQRKVVEMRFYAGFTEEEIAEILNLSGRTVKRDWEAAKAWLSAELGTRAAGAVVEG